MFISLGVIALIVVVMSFSAPAEKEAEPPARGNAAPFVPPMEEPEAVPRMQKPPVPERQVDADKAMTHDEVERAPPDDIYAPETVPMMQRPEPPKPGKGGEDTVEGRVLGVLVTQAAALASGEKAALTLQFNDQEGKRVVPPMLAERHGHIAHFFIIDESLKDFHHVHASAIEPDGTFSVAFTPNTPHNYVLYADVLPVGGEQQVVSAPLQGQSPCTGDCTDRSAGEAAEADGIKGLAAFDAPPLKPGAAQVAKIILTGKDGKPLENLEPVFGAFAHVAAFYEGFGGMVHIHPEGEEPADDKARAASPVAFTLHPEAPGYLKYFVQVRVDGKDVVLPFGVMIEP